MKIYGLIQLLPTHRLQYVTLSIESFVKCTTYKYILECSCRYLIDRRELRPSAQQVTVPAIMAWSCASRISPFQPGVRQVIFIRVMALAQWFSPCLGNDV